MAAGRDPLSQPCSRDNRRFKNVSEENGEEKCNDRPPGGVQKHESQGKDQSGQERLRGFFIEKFQMPSVVARPPLYPLDMSPHRNSRPLKAAA